jgi:hypothetical protein
MRATLDVPPAPCSGVPDTHRPDTGAFLRSLPGPESRAPERPSSHRPARQAPTGRVRRESAPSSGPRERAFCADLRHPPPKHPPARLRGPGGGWYAGHPPGCELLSVRLRIVSKRAVGANRCQRTRNLERLGDAESRAVPRRCRRHGEEGKRHCQASRPPYPGWHRCDLPRRPSAGAGRWPSGRGCASSTACATTRPSRAS